MSKLAVAAASIFLIYMTSASFLIRLVYYERLWYAIGRAGKNGHEKAVVVRWVEEKECVERGRG